MISDTKRINIYDTKIFTAISTVYAKSGPDQIKCTHEMESEFTVNKILLTEFLTDFPNPIISTPINNNKTLKE